MSVDFEVLYGLLFLGTAVPLLLLEAVPSLRARRIVRTRRWTSNVALLVLGTLVSSVVLPHGVHAFAAAQPPAGLARLHLPLVLEVLLAFVVLDLWRYAEHRLFHRVRLLWRWHLVHHSDTDVDVTTSERHHPVELILGTGILVGLVVVLGLPPTALGVYLLAATFIALSSHANVRLPAALDRAVARVLVTPSVHAIHHSSLQRQTDSNYGAVLTIWDHLFGTFVEPSRARVAHHGLDYFHLSRDTGVVGVLLQPFRLGAAPGYPSRRSGDARASDAAAIGGRGPAAPMSRRWKEALVGIAVGGALVSLATWPTLIDMAAAWRAEAYQYAWLVLPLMAYLLWSDRRRHAATVEPQPATAGVAVVIVAALAWSAAWLMNLDVGRQAAFVVALHGVALSALGWRAYRHLFPTLALTFLLIPSGDVLLTPLRLITLQSIDVVTSLARLPHTVDGFVIVVGAHRYIVVDDCAGLPFLTLATFLGYAFGLMLFRTLGRSVAMALAGAGLAVLTNALRVNAIVLVDWWRDSQMDLAAHGVVQWITLLATLAGLFWLVARTNVPGAPGATPAGAIPRPAPGRRFAPIVAGTAGLVIAASAVALPASGLRSPHASGAAQPETLAGWRLARSSGWSVAPGGEAESARLEYVRDDRTIEVLLVEALSPAAKLREPEPAGATWREKQSRVEQACAEARCIPVLHRTLQREHAKTLRHVYSTYALGEYVTASRLALRASSGWQRVSRDAPPARLVAVATDRDLDAHDVASVLAAVVSGFAPDGARH